MLILSRKQKKFCKSIILQIKIYIKKKVMTTVSKFLAMETLAFKKFSQPPFDNLWKVQYLPHDFIEFSGIYIFIFTSGSHCISSVYRWLPV